MFHIFSLLLTFTILKASSNSDDFLIPKQFEPTWSEPPGHVKIYPTDPSAKIKFSWQPMRIKAFYLNYTDDDSYSPSLTASQDEWSRVKFYINQTINDIKQIISFVRRIEGPIRMPYYCIPKPEVISGAGRKKYNVTYCHKATETCEKRPLCHSLPVPLEHGDGCYYVGEKNETVHQRGEGVSEVDLVLYVSIINCDPGNAAKATACQFEPDFSTPVSGMILFCYSTLQSKIHHNYRGIILHEFLHVLLHSLQGVIYRYNDGRRRPKSYVDVKRKWKSANGIFNDSLVTLSILPSVKKFVREHFNCSSLEGAEFKYIPHLSERLFPDALMSPICDHGQLISKLEMAFLNDTGWYKLNESYPAADLTVTRNKGCDFATLSCHEYIEKVNFDRDLSFPYCSLQNKHQWTCSIDDDQSYVFCDTYPFDSNSTMVMRHVEFCPFVRPYSTWEHAKEMCSCPSTIVRNPSIFLVQSFLSAYISFVLH